VATFRFDPAASKLEVHASSSLHGISSKADGVEGELDLTLDASGHGIDLARGVRGSLRFELARLSTGNPLEDVATERAIDRKRYPVVEGALASITAADPDPAGNPGYDVTGELTFHGVGRELTGRLYVGVADGGATVHLWGEQVLDVRAWGVKPPKLGLVRVHPDVRVRLEARATRTSS
jgi:hypothetical protein